MLALLLSIIMMFSLLPVTALAEGEVGPAEEPVIAADPVEAAGGTETEEQFPETESAEETAPTEEPVPSEEPILADETEPAEEPVTTDEASEAEEETEPEEEAEDSSKVLVAFVSEQEIVLELRSGDEVIAPEALEEAENVDDNTVAVYLLEPGSYVYTASMEGFQTLEAVLELTDEDSDKTIEISLRKELPYGFKGMPEGYELSKTELAAKQALVDNDVVATLAGLAPGIDYKDGELILSTDSAEYAAMVAEAYSAELDSYAYGIAVLKLSDATVLDAITCAADMESVLPAVDPNYIVKLDPEIIGKRETPNYYFMQSGEEVPQLQDWRAWYDGSPNPDEHLKDPTAYDYQYMHNVVNTYEAWGVTTGAGVTVAVIDSGVISHEDIKDFSTLDAGLGNSGYEDHGTHVAGIIAATLDNGVGGAGIAPDAEIISVQVFDGSENSGSDATVIRAINAVREDRRAQIINMSLGTYYYSLSEEIALRQAINSGITVVVPMGNDGTNIRCFPAAYNIPGLIAVGATTEAGSRAVYSNYGAWMDVSAPGSAVLSTVPGGYESWDGTSGAAPVVSGVCALYMSVYGNPGPAAMEKIIKKATTNGVVDAAKLFSGDKTAPMIYATGGNALYYDDSTTILFATDSSNNSENSMFIYTLDGKSPSVKNGVVVNGDVVPELEYPCVVNGITYTRGIQITSIPGVKPGTKLTVKAAVVSSMGVMSKVSTRTFTVGYAPSTAVEIIGLPDDVLIPGRSLKLSAKVYPEEADQSVTWRIESQQGCGGTTINTKTGEIKTKATDHGLIDVSATTADGRQGWARIEIAPVLPAKNVILSETTHTLALAVGHEEQFWLYPTAYDANGNGITKISYRWSSSNEKVATVDENGNVKAVGKGKATITCTATDGSNASAKCVVNVVRLVDEISIFGPEYLAPGKTATYKATVSPSTANNKKVQWSVTDNSDVTISSAGKVTVPSYATGSFTIRAKSEDGSSVQYYDVSIVPQITSLYIGNYDPDFNGGGVTWNKNGSLKQAVLFSVEDDYWDGGSKSWHDSWIQLGAYGDGVTGQNVQWISSNKKVATVDSTGLVRAASAGTATITCKALDASGRKATVSIRVINPVSSVTVVSSAKTTYADTFIILGVGKAVKNTAKLGDAFGKPTISKVAWDAYVYVEDNDGNRREDIEGEIYAKKLVTINSSGTVTAKKGLNAYALNFNVHVTVIATSTDGMEVSGWLEYVVYPTPTKLICVNSYGYIGNKTTLRQGGAYDIFTVYGYYKDFDDYYTPPDLTVKSSNPNVAGAIVDWEEEYPEIVVISNSQGKTGTATITVSTTDGSNKSIKITAKVIN